MSSDRRRRTEMARKRPTPEEIVATLRQVDVVVSQRKSVADAVRFIGTTEVTYYLYGWLSRCKPILI
jgi:putative transposase